MIIGEPNESFMEEGWPHGLRCATCDDVFVDGQRIYRRPEGVTGDGTPVVLVICEACAGRAS